MCFLIQLIFFYFIILNEAFTVMSEKTKELDLKQDQTEAETETVSVTVMVTVM